MMILNLLIAVLMSLFNPEGSGGDGGEGAGGDPQPDPKATPPANPPAPSGTGGAPAGSGDKEPPGEGGEPAETPELKASREAAKYRNQAKDEREKNTKLVNALRPMLEALGIKVEGGEPDPVALAKQADEWKGKYVKERLNNAVHREAAKQGATPDKLMRWLRGGDELGGLDPEADTFEQELTSVVQRALTDNPDLKAAPAVPRQSGAEFNGAGGKSLDEQIADAEKAGDIKLSLRLKLAKQNLEGSGSGAGAGN